MIFLQPFVIFASGGCNTFPKPFSTSGSAKAHLASFSGSSKKILWSKSGSSQGGMAAMVSRSCGPVRNPARYVVSLSRPRWYRPAWNR
jgi:hypothetical protein